MRGTDSPRLSRFRRRRPRNRPGRGVRLLDLLHKLVTAGAALATLLKALL